MSILKYLKNIPRSPPIGRQALIVIFFIQIRNEVPGKKKGLVAPQQTTGACRPPQGRQGPFPLYKPWPPSPLSFQPKNSGKKRGVRRRKAAKLYRIAYSFDIAA